MADSLFNIEKPQAIGHVYQGLAVFCLKGGITVASFLNKIFRKAEKTDNLTSQIPALLEQYDETYLRYCVEQEQTVSALEAYLHTSDDPKEIAMQTLKTACAFYGGDWAGILEVDLDLEVWTQGWWYNPGPKDRTMQLVHEVEALEIMPTWIKAMEHNRAIIIPDVKNSEIALTDDLSVYQRLRIRSIIAVPFAPNPMGFLAIRNPTRYIDRPSMANILAYVIHRAMAQQKTIYSAKLALSPERIESGRDVIINFFGEMEICTNKGVLTEIDFNSPKSTRVITYLLLNRKAAHPPLEISSALWPDECGDPEVISRNIRGCIYRFRRAFSLISDYPLVEATPNGYRINPELNIITDIQQFDRLYEAAMKTTMIPQKVDLLKKVVAVYRGSLYRNADSEHWIINQVNYYRLRYADAVNELLSTLASVKDYPCVQQYATESIRVMPGNLRAHYWLIISLYYGGTIELARDQLARSRSALTAEEYDALLYYLKESDDIPIRELST